MRVRGILSKLTDKGSLGVLVNLGSNFTDITNAEFQFQEFSIKNKQMSNKQLTKQIKLDYKE
jgi:hypothetical protein